MKKSILFTLILTATLLTACGADATTPAPVSALEPNSNSSVVAEGTLLPDPSVELSFAQPGILAEVLVAEGDQVEEGSPT
jgi:multidrug efflux pump subunit AcrA (membrane-fusion protein)